MKRLKAAKVTIIEAPSKIDICVLKQGFMLDIKWPLSTEVNLGPYLSQIKTAPTPAALLISLPSMSCLQSCLSFPGINFDVLHLLVGDGAGGST